MCALFCAEEIIDLLADKCKHHPAGLEHIVKAQKDLGLQALRTQAQQAMTAAVSMLQAVSPFLLIQLIACCGCKVEASGG